MYNITIRNSSCTLFLLLINNLNNIFIMKNFIKYFLTTKGNMFVGQELAEKLAELCLPCFYDSKFPKEKMDWETVDGYGQLAYIRAIKRVHETIDKYLEINAPEAWFRGMFNSSILAKVMVETHGEGHVEIPKKSSGLPAFDYSVEIWNLKEGDIVDCKGNYSEYYPKGRYKLESKATIPGNWFLEFLDGVSFYMLRNGVNESDLTLVEKPKKQVDFGRLNITMTFFAKNKPLLQNITKEEQENFDLFIKMLTKSSSFAHKAHKELKKLK